MGWVTAPVVKVELLVGVLDVQVRLDGVPLPDDLDIKVIDILVRKLIGELDTGPESVHPGDKI